MEITEQTVEAALEKQQAIMEKLGEAYSMKLDDAMGHLHNRFVTFISESKLPLPHVVIVLEILLREAVDQAMRQYVGE
jgi:hypothetical protein